MTSIVTTPSRALMVALSDSSDIPTPNLITSGTTTEASVGQLIDADANFITAGVNIGDIVYIYEEGSPSRALTVVEVDQTTLTFLEDGASVGAATDYFIYQQSPITGAQNQGCLLYIGCTQGGGAIQVTTAGNDVVLFRGLSSGVLPVRVKRAWRENRGDNNSIIALW